MTGSIVVINKMNTRPTFLGYQNQLSYATIPTICVGNMGLLPNISLPKKIKKVQKK